MKNKYTIALTVLAVVAVGGALAGISGNNYVSAIPVPWRTNDTAALFYQNMVQRSNNPNQVLNDLAAQQAQRDAWDKLTPQQKQQQYDASIAKFKAHMAARAAAQPQAAIQAAVALPDGLSTQLTAELPSMSFGQVQPSWVGHPNNVETVVFAGYLPTNPLQGTVNVKADGPTGSFPQGYLTPTATGPVKIISYNGTVITLQSQAGTWNVYNGSTVTTKGGVTYKFDVVKRAFVQ